MSEMKLSEAIRLGSMLAPKGVGVLVDVDGHTCALGAACDAVSVRIRIGQRGVNNATFKRWPILRMLVAPPVPDLAGRKRVSVSVAIQTLNDQSGWSRERIADWIETLEAAHQPKVDEPDLVGNRASSKQAVA